MFESHFLIFKRMVGRILRWEGPLQERDLSLNGPAATFPRAPRRAGCLVPSVRCGACAHEERGRRFDSQRGVHRAPAAWPGLPVGGTVGGRAGGWVRHRIVYFMPPRFLFVDLLFPYFASDLLPALIIWDRISARYN